MIRVQESPYHEGMRRSRIPPIARLAPLLLLALALTQIGLARGEGLSPWKGGGFGMFATNDHGAFRSVRVFALLEDGSQERLQIPLELNPLRRYARVLPTRSHLVSLAAAMRGEAPAEARALRVEVWRLDFDDDLRPVQRRLRSATWEPAS